MIQAFLKANLVKYFTMFQTAAEVSDIIRAKVAETPYKLSSYFGWVYDTAWSVAIGLNHSLKYLNESGLHEYSNNPFYLAAVLGGMHDVSFRGISVSSA